MLTAPALVRVAVFPALFVAGALSAASIQATPVRLGSGEHTYEWVHGWGALPDGMTLGNTHGCVVVDSRDRIYLNTDTENAVVVFDPDGNFLSSFGKELAGGLHGMCVSKEGDEEFLYLAHIGRHEVLKTTLEGEVLLRIPWPEESGLYESKTQYRPTSVVVGPDGELFVADGYGASWIHRFEPDGTYSASFGGPGSEKGKLRTPHGMLLDTRGSEPELLVADRENHRLQSFDLKGNARTIVEGMLRRPCHVHPSGDDLVVADLAGRVTILNGDNELVAHLGDNPDESKRARNDVPLDQTKDGEFVSPHCATWDSKGNLYVTDWLAFGRVSKLRRVR